MDVREQTSGGSPHQTGAEPAASVVEYLERRAPGRHPDLPETTAGTIRLDISEDGFTDHWYLTLAHQTVRVTRSAEEADLIIRADREVFDELASGSSHVGAALLRNDLTARGKLPLLMSLRRIFPGPPDARHPREVVRGGRGR